jgi:[ribosomal protein S5]-alanine N-acetyltransferase
MTPRPIPTSRLELQPFTAAAIDALLAADEPRLRELTGASFPLPLAPPPLMDGVLPSMRDRLRRDPSQEGWWGWLVVIREDRRVIGSLVFGGPPNSQGDVPVGFATYPQFEGHGYATEATRALVAWALAQPAVLRVCASIPSWNAGSRRVAEKVGMRPVGAAWDAEVWDEDVDDVLLYAVERPRA